MDVWNRICRKEAPGNYEAKDGNLVRSLRVRDFLGLGVGTIVSASIFTLPGEVAALHAGPAVVVSFVVAAVVAGLVAFAYAEMASAMPFAGSAYSWINVIFGELCGWIAGWALLAEYFIALAFVAAGMSANFRALLVQGGIRLPAALANPLGVNGGVVDLVAVVAILIVAILIALGTSGAARVENLLVIMKVFAILLFVVVAMFAVKAANLHPLVPKFRMTANGPFGGWQGIYAGVSMIFLSYLGFDSIAANSGEARDPQKTMPRGILGSLIIAVVLFVAVALVLVGVLPYSRYANSAEPVGLALRAIGHPGIAVVVQVIAVMGMVTALIGLTLAGSRLLYSFGRDGMLPQWLGKLDDHQRPNRALVVLTVGAVAISAFFPFAFLSQLISAGTLIAFMIVSIAVYPLRHREGKDIAEPAFKMPGYPLMPALGFLASLIVFWGLSAEAKGYAGLWFVGGLIIYFLYGIRHSRGATK